ncbi:MAG: ATP-binding protein [bacterium]
MKKQEVDHFTADLSAAESLKRGIGIAPRLFMLIFALLSLMVVSSLVTYLKNEKVNLAFENILNEFPHERAIKNTQTSITDYLMPANDYLISGDPNEIENSKRLENRVKEDLAWCLEMAREEEIRFVKRIENDFYEIKNLSDKIFSYNPDLVSGKKKAIDMMEEMDALAISTREHIAQLLKVHDAYMKKTSEKADSLWRSAHWWMIGMLVLATILGLSIATYIALSILQPLTMLDTLATKIAEGDLKELLYIMGKGEISSLAESFNKMILSLRHQIQTSKTILNAIADPVFTVDNNMNITYFSPACEELTGYKSYEALGAKCSDIFKSNICHDSCAIKRSALKNKPIRHVEIEIKSKNGDKIPIMASASSIKNYCGEVMGGCEVFADITDWKRMTEELRNTQEQLLQAERLAVLGRLASSVGHELRNPMAVIQNATFYIKSKMKDDNPKLRKHLGIIEDEIEISNKIIADLLEFSIGNKRNNKPDTIIDINQIIESAIKRVQTKKEVTLNKQLDSNLPEIMGDEHQLLQVLINMISNAYQAIPKSGGQVDIITRESNNGVDVLVCDNGCGIAEEDIDKLFDPFFTTKSTGIGLGLTITKSIINNHEATLKVESKKGEGTRFIIHFHKAKALA